MHNITIIDNFFEDPNTVRKVALEQKYYDKDTHPGNIGIFPGMRSDYLNNIVPDLYDAMANAQLNNVKQLINIENYTEYWTKFAFSYTLQDTPIKMHRDFEEGWNGFKTFFGGVLYLTPNPQANSGTIVEDEIVENVYNRYVMYDATCLHGLEDSFGKDKEDSRLVLTHFIYLK